MWHNRLIPQTVLVTNFNTQYSPVDRSPEQELNSETLEVRTPQVKWTSQNLKHIPHKYQSDTDSLAPHGTSSKTVQTLRHKASLRENRKIEIII